MIGRRAGTSRRRDTPSTRRETSYVKAQCRGLFGIKRSTKLTPPVPDVGYGVGTSDERLDPACLVFALLASVLQTASSS